MQSKKIKRIIALVLSAAFFLVSLFAVQRLLMPKYMHAAIEGNLTKEYYDDPHQNQVLIIGDCEVYENISPVALWEAYGYSSYIRGNPKQLMWHSYAMLEDALRYETPQVVVLSVLGMMYNEPPHDMEEYNRMALDGLPWSRSKWDAIQASMLEKESAASYALPLLRFHSRWSELDSSDFQFYFNRHKVSIAGFVMRSDVLPAPDEFLPPLLLPDYNFGDTAWDYMNKIKALCDENGIQLVLFKAPSLTPHWYDEWDAQIVAYAKQHGLSYLNALDAKEEIGLNYAQDTYDMGLHLNRQGAEKMAHYLGGFLQTNCPSLEDKRGDKALQQDWAVKIAQYRAMQAAQEEDLAVGAIKTFWVPEIEP